MGCAIEFRVHDYQKSLDGYMLMLLWTNFWGPSSRPLDIELLDRDNELDSEEKRTPESGLRASKGEVRGYTSNVINFVIYLLSGTAKIPKMMDSEL